MSLFNRPTWFAKAQTSDVDDEPGDIFKHSSHSYREIVEDQERRKREKEERKRAKADRKASEKRKSDEFEEKADIKSEGSIKRRRITGDAADKLLSETGFSPAVRESPRLNRVVNRLEDEEEDAQLRSRSHRSNGFDSPSKDSKAPKPAAVIDLGGSSESDAPAPTERHPAPVPEPEPADEESDDEFAELARQARANRQKQQQLQRSHSTQTPEVQAKSPTPGAAADTTLNSVPTPPIQDPTVQLFISSDIPNTKPLIVHRKMSQRLQEIRKVWCQKQGFDEETTKSVFLIHRMRKLYDVTTCRSLGLEVDSQGNVTMKGADGKEGVNKIHLQAVTDEIFQELKRKNYLDEQKRNGMLGSADAEISAEDAARAKKPEEPLIRLVLKAKGKPEFKLKVKPTTLFSKIMVACSKTFGTAEGSLFLEFDGERLNPDEAIKDTEVSDMDCIDVHIG